MKSSYKEISNAQISDKRKLVISQHIKDGEPCGFTLAQQMDVVEGKKITKVFLRGGVHIASVENLVNLRDALNVALDELNKNKN